jgi:hypothetical protein
LQLPGFAREVVSDARADDEFGERAVEAVTERAHELAGVAEAARRGSHSVRRRSPPTKA